MTNSVMIDNGMSVGLGCEAVPIPKASSSEAADEPKRAFADTPPLAKIRDESRSQQADPSEVQSEGEVSRETRPFEDQHKSGGEARSVDDEPTCALSETATEPVAMPTTEGQAAQGDTPAMIPDQAGVGDTGILSATPIVAGGDEMQVLPGPADGGPKALDSSQVLVHKDLVNMDVVVAEAGTPRAGLPVSMAEASVDSSTTASIQAPEASERPQNHADATVPTATKGEQGTPVADATVLTATKGEQSTPVADARATTGDQVADLGGSEGRVVTHEKADSSAPAVAQTVEIAQKESSQQASGENLSSRDLENANAAAAVPRTAARDPGGPHSQSERDPSQESPSTRLQGAVQAVATEGQATAGGFSDTRAGEKKAQTEMLVPSLSTAAPAAQGVSTQAAAPSETDTVPLKSPVQNVGAQILDSVHASLARGDKQVLIRLDPPELGSVMMRFTEQGDRVGAVLEVSRNETRQEIEQALPQVLRSLQEAGVQIRRVDVVVSDQPERDLSKEQLQQDAWGHQQGSGQHGGRSGHSSAADWSAWTGAQQAAYEREEATGPKIGAAQGRIDMLV